MILRPFQKDGVAYAVDKRRVFLAWEMGLGKTCGALATLEQTGAFPALIVCPPKLVTNWCVEARRWLPARRVGAVITATAASQGAAARLRRLGVYPSTSGPRLGCDLTVVPYSLVPGLVMALRGVGYTGIVSDESHVGKSSDAEITRALYDVASTVHEVRLALSGTPNMNGPEDFIAQLRFLGRLDTDFGGEAAFRARYVGNPWRLHELNARLRAVCLSRYTKAEVLPDLPPLDRVRLRVDLPDTHGTADYREAHADTAAFLARRAADTETVGDPNLAAARKIMAFQSNEWLVRLTTLKRLAAIAKIPLATAWARDFLEGGARKLIVFAHHVDVLDALAHTLDCDVIHGTSGDPSAAVERFQTDPDVRVICVGVTCGGVGLTLTAASDELFVEQVWRSTDHDQAESRAYGRVNDPHGVTATYMTAEGTVDDYVWPAVESKRAEFAAAIDGPDIPLGKQTLVAYEQSSSVAQLAAALWTADLADG